jgi:hypothetical protein
MSDLFTFDSLNQQFQEINKLTQNEQESEKTAGKVAEGTAVIPFLPLASEIFSKGSAVVGKLQEGYQALQKLGSAVQQVGTKVATGTLGGETGFTAGENAGAIEMTDVSGLSSTVEGAGIEPAVEGLSAEAINDLLPAGAGA